VGCLPVPRDEKGKRYLNFCSEWYKTGCNERCWIYIIEDGAEYRRNAVELMTQEVIRSYQQLGDSKSWSDWMHNILSARQVLVPAATFHERVLARFDPVTLDRLVWKTIPDEPSDLESFFHANERRNRGIRLELKNERYGKEAQSFRTNELMEIAQKIVVDCHLSIKAKETHVELDLLEIARSLLDPFDEKEEWPIFKNIILRWKSDNQLKKVRNWVTLQDLQHPQPAAQGNEGIEEPISKEISACKLQCI